MNKGDLCLGNRTLCTLINTNANIKERKMDTNAQSAPIGSVPVGCRVLKAEPDTVK